MNTKMNTMRGCLACTTILAWLGLACPAARAQLPTNFPAIAVTTYDSNKVAPGYLFVGTWSSAPNSGSFLMILDNDGTPVDGDKYVELQKTAIDFKVQPNGLLSYAQSLAPLVIGGGWDVEHKIVDESVTNIVESVQMQNGYLAESHDFQVLPNGNILQFGYYFSEVDLSQIVSGGNPAALVSGCVIQEVDSQRNAVFQWRSWDHYNFEDFSYPNPTASTISQFHVNDIILDVDGNIIAGTPREIRKINRQTGEVMWTLGGSDNEFTIVGSGFTASDFGGHGTYRLANGNFLEYDNSHGGMTSRALEYSLDESNKIATVVWSYTPPTPILGFATGYAQRLNNGNTLICWGIPRFGNVPVCTEVTSAGEKVFELTFTNTALSSYRAFRFPYPAATQKIEFTQLELAAGNSYNFTNTGVSLTVNSGGGGYNILTVTREPYAPVDPLFQVQGKAPRVLPIRVGMTESGIGTMNAQIEFDATSFGFANPTNLTIYYRNQIGQLFLAQTNDYNQVTKKLRVTLTLNSQSGQFGEFIFGYPDVADVPYPPLLAEVESYRGVQTNNVIAPHLAMTGMVYSVNQELPVLLSWSPKGFARWYELQIATNSDFASPIVNVLYQTDAFKVWSNAAADMTYLYRVKTVNDGGESDWSVGSFQTVAPMVEVTAPNGGEAWQRGVRHYIQWEDNLAEDVVIDLYKGGVFLKSIATNSSAGAYRWEVGFDLQPGYDYSVKISSSTNASLFDVSDNTFTIIDAPIIDANAITPLPDGRMQLGLTVPGAAETTVLGSTNLEVWQELQTVPLTNGSAIFTDDAAAGLPYRFYRLRIP